MTTTVPPARKRFRLSPPLLVVGAVILVAIVGIFFLTRPKTVVEPYRATPVSTGSIVKTVSASGTLQALVTVDVGSQVNGQVQEVLVDFDDHVTKGQILARIDPQTFQSRLDSSRAESVSAQQAVASAEANLQQTVANARVTEEDYNRTRSLFQKGYVAEQALQKAEAQLASARASIKVQQAQIAQARARLQQTNASVRTTNIDLARTVIVSPINGVVVDRKVDPGQTVVSSMSAQTLFKIAQDLSKLQLKILVDEADIGAVTVGQTVNFTVDAFPDARFRGTVTQVRKQPETQNNVVAYVVIAEADNPDGRLLPGMTANAQITLERKNNVLRVPIAALRWTPADLNAQQQSNRPPGLGGGFGGGFGPRPGGQQTAARGGRNNPMAVYDQIALSPKQQIEIDKIQTEMRDETRERLREQQKAQGRGEQIDRQAVQQEMRQRTEAVQAKIDALLTPEQKKQVEALRSGAQSGPQLPRGQVYVLRDGKPIRVGVGVGASDGTVTEVVSPNLKVGDLVITAGGPKLATRGGAPAGGAAGGRT